MLDVGTTDDVGDGLGVIVGWTCDEALWTAVLVMLIEWVGRGVGCMVELWMLPFPADDVMITLVNVM